MALLLAPGFMTDADLWRDVVGAFQNFGPILHIDLSQDVSISAMAHRALENAPASFILFGFSMGGYVAREMARLAPERVQALVLIATSARGDTAAQVQRKAATASRLAATSTVNLSRSAIAMSLHPDRAREEALIDRIYAMGARLGPETFRRQLMLPRTGDLDQLHAVRSPTLVVAGRHDRLRSLAESMELQKGIVGTELKIIEEAGHMIPMEAPLALAGEVISWLSKLANASHKGRPR